jgi:peptide/nickel transport system substrate-binding protein
MYLPSSAQGLDAMLQNKADPEFMTIGDKLANGDFKDLVERKALMEKALELSLQDSLQLFLIDGKNYVPYVKGVSVTADLAAGVEGAQVWPLTIRRVGQEGGDLKWGTSDVFTEPWNPVAGSNWAWDQAVIRATSSGDQLYDPFTGLIWPMRLDKAEVTVLDGATVGTTLPWVTLNFAPEIKVPADAIVDWDATAQKWITAGEKFPEGITAKRKSVATYPADLFKTVKWHDGSFLSMGDIMLSLIYTFDRAKPESLLYDEVYAPSFDAFLETFKGLKIVSTEPLVYEFYSDNFVQDAELNVGSLWPAYGFGEGSWPVMALGTKAEEKGELAYSIDKSGALEIEQTSFIGGPSLAVLTADLTEAIEAKYLPYAPTMSQYVTAKEIKNRYAAVQAFYEKLGHYWIGTGPYYVAQPLLTEKILTLKAYRNYPDLSDRWNQFTEPKLATVALTGPGNVKIGDEAVYDVAVTFKDAPYPMAEIKEVKYMVYNSKGEMIKLDVAEAVVDGQYRIVLSKELTAGLEAGTNKLEVAVIPLPVAIPAFTSIPFVTAK